MRIHLCVVAAFLIMMLAGCRSETPSSPTATATTANDRAPAAAALRVALLHSGRENDRGWNQLAYESLMELGKTPGVSVKHAFSPDPSRIKSDIRAFAQQDYALVICHGSEFVKAARQVAPDFPNTRFVVTGSAEAGDGVATLDFRLWEATYLCGMLGAALAPDGPAGLIGAVDAHTVRNTLDAFANGARAMKPGYVTYAQYVGNWEDVAKANLTARALIDGQRVRVLFQNCDAAAFGVFQGASESKIPAFGCNGNQNREAGGFVPASAVIDMAEAFRQAVAMVRENRFEARPIVHDLRSGGIKFVPNADWEAKWPAGTRERIQQAEADIAAGKLDVLARP